MTVRVEVEEDQGLPPQSVSGSSLAEVAESSSPDAGGGPAGKHVATATATVFLALSIAS